MPLPSAFKYAPLEERQSLQADSFEREARETTATYSEQRPDGSIWEITYHPADDSIVGERQVSGPRATAMPEETQGYGPEFESQGPTYDPVAAQARQGVDPFRQALADFGRNLESTARNVPVLGGIGGDVADIARTWTGGALGKPAFTGAFLNPEAQRPTYAETGWEGLAQSALNAPVLGTAEVAVQPFLSALGRNASDVAQATGRVLRPEPTYYHRTNAPFAAAEIAPQGGEPIFLSQQRGLTQYGSRELPFNIAPEARTLDLRKMPQGEAIQFLAELKGDKTLLDALSDVGYDVVHGTSGETMVTNPAVLRARGGRQGLGQLATEESGYLRLEPGDIGEPRPPAAVSGGNVPPSGGVPGITTNVDDFLRNLDASDEVKTFLRDTIEEGASAVQAQRRGVLSDEMVNSLADQIGFQGERLARMKKGTALNPEQTRAAARSFLGMADDVHAAVTAAQSGSFEDRLLAIERVVKLQAAEAGLFGTRAEAGRSLRQWRAISSAISETPKTNYQKVLDQIDPENRTQDVLNRLAQIPEGDNLALLNFLRDANTPKFADYLHAYQYANMLSGPLTHQKNAFGNVTQFMIELAATGVTRPKEVPPMVAGWLAGLPQGARQAGYIIKNGIDLENLNKLELDKRVEFKGAMSLFNYPGRLLVAADELFGNAAFQSKLYARAWKLAKGNVEEAARLRANPTPAMVEEAQRFRGVATFTDNPTDFGYKTLRALQQIAIPEEVPVLGGYQVGRVLVPFARTLSNITKRSLEVGGGGYLAAAVKAVQKDPTAVESLGRALVGTGVFMTVGLPMGLSGRLTGAAPENQADREMWFATGRRPFSLKVGDNWVPYLWLGPMAMPLIEAAAVAEAFNKTGKPPDGKEAERVVRTLSGVVRDQTFATTLNLLTELANMDPDSVGRLLATMASQFSPLSGLQRQVERGLDRYIRDPDRWQDEALRSAVPALEWMLPKRMTPLGDEAQRSSAGTPLAFTPFAGGVESRDPAVLELNKYGITPGFVGRKLTIEGIEVPLNDAQWRVYQEIRGGFIKDSVLDVLAEPGYFSEEEAIKKEALEIVVERAQNESTAIFKEMLLEGAMP